MANISISKARLASLEQNPLLFLRKVPKYIDDHWVEVWEPIDKTISHFFIDKTNFAYRPGIKDTLVVACITQDIKEKSGDTVSVPVCEINESDINHWIYILNCFIYHNGEARNIYPYWELLWAIGNTNWKSEVLHSAISKYSENFKQKILNGIKSFGPYVSYNRRVEIDKLLNLFNNAGIECRVNYDIYKALEYIHGENKNEFGQDTFKDIFSQIEKVLLKDNYYRYIPDNAPTNKYLQVAKWLSDENYSLDNYDGVIFVYPFVNATVRLDIIRRYFHDIRNKKTVLDLNILEQFKNNKYSKVNRFRTCLFEASDPVDLSPSLLADSLLTLINSKGEAFQKFNGILDLAMLNANSSNPRTEFGLIKLLPTCDGGLFVNDQFKGFLNLEVYYNLNNELISDKERLQKTVLSIIRSYGCENKRHYFHQSQKRGRIEISHDAYVRYKKLYKDSSNTEVVTDSNVFVVHKSTDIIQVFNLFTKDNCEYQQLQQHSCFEYSTEYIDIEKFQGIIKDTIILGISKQKTGAFILSADFLKANKWVNKFITPCRIYMTPYQDIDIADRNINSNSILLSSQDIYTKTSNKLKKVFPDIHMDGTDSYIQYSDYNKQILKEIFKSFVGLRDDQKNNYLRPFKVERYKLCSPHFHDNKDELLEIPFWWCQGKDCYKNSLNNQTLANVQSWKSYTLYHVAEILNFHLLEKCEAGYKPKKIVRDFCQTINKAYQIYHRLNCRSCGHIMFTTDHGGEFAIFSNFKCENPQCQANNNTIYLSHCHNCSGSIIDSRDTKKCPNEWYICPSCYTCCSNKVFQSIADRYTRAQKPVPRGILMMLGRGHLESQQKYCTKCGRLLQVKSANDKKIVLTCQMCNKDFECTIYRPRFS